MSTIIKPPAPLPTDDPRPSVFLSGSIDMGRAEPWQASVEAALADLDLVVFNPRRDAWDSSWVQSIDNPQFREQVEWELAALERATLIAAYFDPDSKAPITLLEFGLHARSGRLIVCCPAGFYRRGNIEVVCARYGVPLLDDLPALIRDVRQRLAPG